MDANARVIHTQAQVFFHGMGCLAMDIRMIAASVFVQVMGMLEK